MFLLVWRRWQFLLFSFWKSACLSLFFALKFNSALRRSSMALNNPNPLGPWKVSVMSAMAPSITEANTCGCFFFYFSISCLSWWFQWFTCLYTHQCVRAACAYYMYAFVSSSGHCLWPGELPGEALGIYLSLPEYHGLWCRQHPLSEGGVWRVSQTKSSALETRGRCQPDLPNKKGHII